VRAVTVKYSINIMGDHFNRKGTEWIHMWAGLCQASLSRCCISWWKAVNKSPTLRFQNKYRPNFRVLDAKHKLKVRDIKSRKIIHYLFGVLAGTTNIWT